VTPRKRLTGPIHDRLRQLIDDAGLNLTEFADKVGVHISVASHWVNGRSRPGLERLPKIARVLGVTELQLVRNEPAWAPYERLLKRTA
jgi:transcriptional regulator with XRE-family HTH domain